MSRHAMTSVVVLGHHGMLGHVVARRARERGLSVATTDRRYEGDPSDPFVTEAVSSGDVIINCAGVTTQRGIVDQRLLVGNSLLPQHLAAALGAGQLLIHASTDCVFSGRRGWYEVTERPDPVDAYGLSKWLGERALEVSPAQTVVLRTSIVGPEDGTAHGLLAWYLSQRGQVNGWTDHRWNGITTLAWADLALDIAAGRSSLGPGLHQPSTEEAVTKHALLGMFGRAFGHSLVIAPTTSANAIDRTLRPTLPMPPLEAQLAAVRQWYGADAT
jgi:dTDP-4-dehydrorhamnose reductase